MTVTKKSVLIYFLVFLFAMAAVLSFVPQQAQAVDGNGNFVVVVDPGHVCEDGAWDDGTVVRGVVESRLNEQLAAKIVSELNALGNVEVYTTLNVPGRTGLLGSSEPNVSLLDRVRVANNVRADLFISVHHNSYGTAYNSASGVTVQYDAGQPNYTRSKAAALSVYNSVASLGSSYKGNRSQPVYNEAATVLRGCNMPSIMLEAGFMTNQSDLARMTDSYSQSLMAKQVAQGISSFLAPSGKQDTSYPKADSVTASDTPSNHPVFTIAANGVRDNSGILSVYVETYPKGNPDVSETLDMERRGNNLWKVNVDVADLFGDVGGTYTVDAYAIDYAGNTAKIGTTSVKYNKDTKPPKAASVKVNHSKSKKPTFTFTAFSVKDPSGVASVYMNVYPKGKKGQGYFTVKAKMKGNNKWVGTVNLKKLYGNQAGGKYVVEVRAVDKKGNSGLLSKKTINYLKTPAPALSAAP